MDNSILQIVEFLIYLSQHSSYLHKSSPSELFLKKSPRSHLDLLNLNVESTVHLSQIKKKAQNDLHPKGRELFIAESIMAKNF